MTAEAAIEGAVEIAGVLARLLILAVGDGLICEPLSAAACPIGILILTGSSRSRPPKKTGGGAAHGTMQNESDEQGDAYDSLAIRGLILPMRKRAKEIAPQGGVHELSRRVLLSSGNRTFASAAGGSTVSNFRF